VIYFAKSSLCTESKTLKLNYSNIKKHSLVILNLLKIIECNQHWLNDFEYDQALKKLILIKLGHHRANTFV